MKVLVACEESQTVCKAFRERGHEAYSCDIQEPSGGHPEWHIHGDAIAALDGGVITTMDGKQHDVGKWDLLIAHPPCTYLTVTGNRWFNEERYGGKARQRKELRNEAAIFFMSFINADVDKIAVENPIGYMSTAYQKPTQIIQPWMFGDNYSKSTCLWLKGLPALVPQVTEQPELEWKEWIDKKTGRKRRQPLWYYEALVNSKTPEERAKIRSKTFPGIAIAMSEQWGR